MPYYVVRQGRKPGIYKTWDECKEQIHRFGGAQYKKCASQADAQEYLTGESATTKVRKTVETKTTSKVKVSQNTTLSSDVMHNVINNLCTATSTTTISKLLINKDEHEFTAVYSDGCCFGNGQMGSRAGYGVYWDENHPWNISERLMGDQTNQRAELTAAIAAMEVALSNGISHLEIRTDSKYTIQSATEWIRGWKKSNWIKKTDSKPVMNRDLMMKIDELQQKLTLKWTYVPGHSSNKGNDGADALAKAGARK